MGAAQAHSPSMPDPARSRSPGRHQPNRPLYLAPINSSRLSLGQPRKFPLLSSLTQLVVPSLQGKHDLAFQQSWA